MKILLKLTQFRSISITFGTVNYVILKNILLLENIRKPRKLLKIELFSIEKIDFKII